LFSSEDFPPWLRLCRFGLSAVKALPVRKCFPWINQGEHQRPGLTTEATKATENHQQAFSKGNLPIPSVFSVLSAVKAFSQFANVFRIGCGSAALGFPWLINKSTNGRHSVREGRRFHVVSDNEGLVIPKSKIQNGSCRVLALTK